MQKTILNLNSIQRNLNNNVFFFFNKMTLNWFTTVKTYGGKRSSKMVDDNASDADRDTAQN